MNGWGVALLTGLVAGVWIMWQNERLDDMKREVGELQSLIEGIEAQRENTQKYDNIDRELRDGGEDNLSDYMRGAADKLWPSP